MSPIPKSPVKLVNGWLLEIKDSDPDSPTFGLTLTRPFSKILNWTLQEETLEQAFALAKKTAADLSIPKAVRQ